MAITAPRTRTRVTLLALLLALGALLFAPGTASAAVCDVSWTGASSDQWWDSNNWSTNVVPDASQVVCVDSGLNPDVHIVMHDFGAGLVADFAVKELDVASGFSVTL